MASNEFRLEWTGLQEMQEAVAGLEEAFIDNLIEAMREYTLLVEEGAKALAFRDTGDLEQSISAKAVVRQGETIIGEVGTNLSYALYIHEKPYNRPQGDKYDNGIVIRGYYVWGRGQRTRAKATWRGELPGRKFLERVIVLTETDFYAAMDRAWEKTLKEAGLA